MYTQYSFTHKSHIYKLIEVYATSFCKKDHIQNRLPMRNVTPVST